MSNLFTFSDLYLSRRLELTEGMSSAAFVEARAKAFPELAAAWRRIGGALAMFDGPGSPLSQTFGLGIFQTPTAEDFEKIETFFSERGSDTNQEVSPLADPTTLTLLNERNYHPIEFTSLLYQSLSAKPTQKIAWNDAIKVKICAPEEYAIWTSTMVEGWSELQEYLPFLQEIGEVNTHRSDATLFLAELGGQPVAASLLSVHEGVALLAGASTIPSARRQGAQLALLESRLFYAREQGCELAMMGATPGSSSQRNAERHGFRIAYTRVKWKKGY